jgi:ribokinase
MTRIAVLGSVHMDLIAQSTRLPGPGESVSGDAFQMSPGGKAGNQATQCARLGADTFIITQLGDDLFGHELLQSLQDSGVHTDTVLIDPNHKTGASTVFASQGDYCSIIYPGAAAQMRPSDAAEAVRGLDSLDALIVQLELPLAISVAAAEAAAQAGARVVLNASPATRDMGPVIQKLMPYVSALVVNRVEAGLMLGRQLFGMDLGHAARTLAGMGPQQVIITAGREGSVAWDGALAHTQPAFQVGAVDAVGAGDAFLGAYVTLTAMGADLDHAMLCGAAAGALATTQAGATGGLPTMQELEDFLHNVHESLG